MKWKVCKQSCTIKFFNWKGLNTAKNNYAPHMCKHFIKSNVD